MRKALIPLLIAATACAPSLVPDERKEMAEAKNNVINNLPIEYDSACFGSWRGYFSFNEKTYEAVLGTNRCTPWHGTEEAGPLWVTVYGGFFPDFSVSVTGNGSIKECNKFKLDTGFFCTPEGIESMLDAITDTHQ